MNKIIFAIIVMLSSQVFAEKVEDMQVTGEKIDREGIRKTFLDHQKDLMGCYNKALANAKKKTKETGKESQSLAGKMTLDFTIDEDGSVMYMQMDSGRSNLKDMGVAGCIIKQGYSWIFPKPPKGQTVQVFYPLAFSPK